MSVPRETPTGHHPPDQPESPWQLCPACGARRLARCPVCRTAGVDFPSADPDPDGTRVERIICPTCDEAFAPQYARRCEWCGHFFAEGFEPPAPPRPREPVNRRALAVVVALVAVVGALAAYFAFLF